MTEPKHSWTQPICEADWIEKNSHDENGYLVIKRPTILRNPTMEWCAWCAKPTISGIYVRADPKSVPYPTEDDDE